MKYGTKFFFQWGKKGMWGSVMLLNKFRYLYKYFKWKCSQVNLWLKVQCSVPQAEASHLDTVTASELLPGTNIWTGLSFFCHILGKKDKIVTAFLRERVQALCELCYRDIRYALRNLLAQSLWGFTGAATVSVAWGYVGKMGGHRFWTFKANENNQMYSWTRSI